MSLNSLDWTKVQSFLAVIESGSLSGAARDLGLTQTTLGRHVKGMEDELGVTLFLRRKSGVEPTEAALALVEAARIMAEGAHRLQMTAAGHEEGMAGTVRVSGAVMICDHLLPPILAELRDCEPDIQVELSPSESNENLLFREADIAVRTHEPTQLDMIARQLGDMELRLYASSAALQRLGSPASLEQALERDFVGFDRDDRIIKGLRSEGVTVQREDFTSRCDDMSTYVALVRGGCGYGFIPRAVAETMPDLVHVDVPEKAPTLPVWITAHEGMRRTPRVKRVWDFLVSNLTRDLSAAPNDSSAFSTGLRASG